ncbi:MAG: hypothetical protein L3J52_02690 [Proteobacteria bacterium]|nr:hypothetical protein [Pseudomonadota bacterium]
MSIDLNFNSIHLEEEKNRQLSINTIEQDGQLSKHFSAIHDSMDIISFIVNNNQNYSPDESTIMRLGIRNFNLTAGSLKLGLSGYYQSAISQIREIFETVMLLDYFGTYPKKISEWTESDKKHRLKHFSPFQIRVQLDKRDGLKEQKRAEAYSLLSELASHPTSEGFKLFSPNSLSKIGPFFDDKYLKAWIQELVKLVPHGSVVFIELFNDSNLQLLKAQEHFLTNIKPWEEEFMCTNN